MSDTRIVPPERVGRIAVLGTGTIGASWGAWFLARGKRVAFYDPNQGAEEFARRFIANAWPILTQLGLAAGADPEAWSFHTDPAASVRDAQFVQENAPERLAVKRELYAAIEPVLAEDAILASSTSGIIMSELQHGFRIAPRMAIGHPFNPPHLIPLVEVVGGRDTAPETIAWCLAFYEAIGKRPIHIRKEAPGHLANRLQAALYREAVHAVVSGLASVADDRVRDRLVGERTALMNQLRAILLERGIAIPQGRRKLEQQLAEMLDGNEVRLSPRVRLLLKGMQAEWREMDRRIEAFDDEFATHAKTNDAARRLATIPGIGVLNATALAAAVGNAGTFARGRDLAAWLGLVPRQMTTGGKPRLLGISKRGNKYLRKLLIHGARAALPSLSVGATPLGKWLRGLLERAHKNTAIVALANKLARIVWAVLRQGGTYNAAAMRAA